VTESSKGNKHLAASTSVTAERNRLMSWDSTVQGLTKPGHEIPGSKIAIIHKPFGFSSKIRGVFFVSLATLPYTLLKLGFEIAKLVTRGLSTIRRLLSG